MSKRLTTVITILILLVGCSAAYMQGPPPGDLILTLTEARIDDEFYIPSTAFHTVSSFDVDVQPDGVHITLNATTLRDGTPKTLSLVAILVGRVQENRVVYTFDDLQILRYDHRLSNAALHEIGNLLITAWRSCANNALREIDLRANNIAISGIEMDDNGIYVYGTERVGAGWCLECVRD